jgi:type I restriction enzyme S subunit
MLTGDIRNQIDRIWDAFWSGGIANPILGDVLISCSGTIGRIASVETPEPFSLVRSVALVRPKKHVLSTRFLEHYLRTPALKAQMLRRANASSQANLFQGPIRHLPLFLPPLNLQHDFARRVVAVEKLKVAHYTSLSEFDALLQPSNTAGSGASCDG